MKMLSHYPIFASAGAVLSTLGILIAQELPQDWANHSLTTLFGIALVAFLTYVIPQIIRATTTYFKENNKMWSERIAEDKKADREVQRMWMEEMKGIHTEQQAHDHHMKTHWNELKDVMHELCGELKQRPCILQDQDTELEEQ